MPVRIMPKKIQIAAFRRLFQIWDKWREEDYTKYDVRAKMDNVDWDIIDEGANFLQNRCYLLG